MPSSAKKNSRTKPVGQKLEGVWFRILCTWRGVLKHTHTYAYEQEIPNYTTKFGEILAHDHLKGNIFSGALGKVCKGARRDH